MKQTYLTYAFLASIFLFTKTNSYSQTYDPYFGNLVDNVSATNIVNNLTAFQNFGVKEVGTQALTNAENWITTHYTNLGYSNIELQSFTYSSGTSNNIIVTKTGTTYPNTFLIIDGHYDTINGPGTNDNGSGTVLIMELARLLATVPTEYSIKFIHFSGEEDGLVGSNYYVNNTVIPQNLDIKLVLNIDEVGGVNGMTNNTIVCERDQSNTPSTNNAASNTATNQLATCIELYSNLNTEISYAYASDYIPFEDNNEIITGLYEYNETPYAHGPNDVLANMDTNYLYEVTKGTLGAALFFAEVDFNALHSESFNLDPTINMYPNPSKGILHVDLKTLEHTTFKLMDILGKEVLSKTLKTTYSKIDVSYIKKGVYLAVFETNNNRITKKLIIY
ncbi:Aminopeptidase Y (Arg, Lys, Leu preference) [Xanthomarina gelatinilytica]|uniref:Aminopeptidase Y (Arg, Lys, Leu preference) n=1 Tax=Xanthomarina gelatinilytica TaxID=1137281 RepID=M7ME04_9FLAO|nr:M28 family peptidase [Xanthomarina gelatinilytica]EMQ94397.1 Aminopeptidase Y (Arg, Lys, Leu preference) [Xanthomarina gelatinilytica]